MKMLNMNTVDISFAFGLTYLLILCSLLWTKFLESFRNASLCRLASVAKLTSWNKCYVMLSASQRIRKQWIESVSCSILTTFLQAVTTKRFTKFFQFLWFNLDNYKKRGIISVWVKAFHRLELTKSLLLRAAKSSVSTPAPKCWRGLSSVKTFLSFGAKKSKSEFVGPLAQLVRARDS